MSKNRSAEKTVRDIRRATRRHYSAEEKIRTVLEGLRGEDNIARAVESLSRQYCLVDPVELTRDLIVDQRYGIVDQFRVATRVLCDAALTCNFCHSYQT
ncbi:MAG: hypothetical protein WBO58_00365 [Gammaproteobacteria bacterium]